MNALDNQIGEDLSFLHGAYDSRHRATVVGVDRDEPAVSLVGPRLRVALQRIGPEVAKNGSEHSHV